MRFNILRRLQMGFSISEYELQMGGFLESLAFAPVGFGIGIALLFFPEHVRRWFDKLAKRVQPEYSPLGLFIVRLGGLIFILATVVALWTTSKFLFS